MDLGDAISKLETLGKRTHFHAIFLVMDSFLNTTVNTTQLKQCVNWGPVPF